MVIRPVKKKRKLGKKITSYLDLCKSLYEKGIRPYSKAMREAGIQWRKLKNK